jgi:hypothetical protein
MIRLFVLLLIASTLPAFAEGPQELELDRSLAQMQGQAASPAYTAAPVTTTLPTPPAKPGKPAIEGHNERLMDEGLQPESPPDPQGDAMVRKLNGGQ